VRRFPAIPLQGLDRAGAIVSAVRGAIGVAELELCQVALKVQLAQWWSEPSMSRLQLEKTPPTVFL
jgi:hypothetical protein